MLEVFSLSVVNVVEELNWKWPLPLKWEVYKESRENKITHTHTHTGKADQLGVST